jgi:hypothetical protein
MTMFRPPCCTSKYKQRIARQVPAKAKRCLAKRPERVAGVDAPAPEYRMLGRSAASNYRTAYNRQRRPPLCRSPAHSSKNHLLHPVLRLAEEPKAEAKHAQINSSYDKIFYKGVASTHNLTLTLGSSPTSPGAARLGAVGARGAQAAPQSDRILSEPPLVLKDTSR